MSKTKASTETFLEQIRSGKLLNDKQRLYVHIKKHPGITLNDLSRGTRIVIQTASARLSDLMDLGVVEVIATQSRVGTVSVSFDSMLKIQEEPDKIFQNQINRNEAKFKRAVKAVLAFENNLDIETVNQLKKKL